jgi:hypothetical protein
VQDKCFAIFCDDFACELGLLERRINDLVFMVFEDAEELIEADIYRGRLDHRIRERLDPYAFFGNLGTDITVTK